MAVTIIKKSKFASFLGRLILALMVGGIGGSFIYFVTSGMMGGDAPAWFKTAFFIGGVCMCIAALLIFVSALRYFFAKSNWRVEISNDKLKWQSAAEHLQKSFQVQLSDIDYVQTVVEVNTSRRGKGPRSASNLIHLKSGKVITVREDISGIWPHRVFKALEKHGVDYLRADVRSLSAYRAMKTEDMPEGVRESLKRNNTWNNK